MEVIARLRAGPIVALIAIALALGAYALWELVSGDRFSSSIYSHIFGPLTGPLVIGAALIAAWLFGQMWRERSCYLRHDGMRLYRGSRQSWPLSSIHEVVLTRNMLGIQSLRIVHGRADSRELAKGYLLAESPSDVRTALERAIYAAQNSKDEPS